MTQRGISIALACRTFKVSETCYRYHPKLDAENERIAGLLLGLTQTRPQPASAAKIGVAINTNGRRLFGGTIFIQPPDSSLTDAAEDIRIVDKRISDVERSIRSDSECETLEQDGSQR